MHTFFARSVAIALALVLVGAACNGGDTAPRTLLDGSDALAPEVELHGAPTPAVLTEVRVVDATGLDPHSLAARCIRHGAPEAAPRRWIVERIGISGESVTLLQESGLYACDDSAGRREPDQGWCGGAFGRLVDGHLSDPRLSIAGCTTGDGKPMGFAWVEPRGDTRFVAVMEPGFTEVYETAAGLPVRVSTVAGFRRDPLGAVFELSEHDARGRLLRRYRLHARPAG